MRIAAAALIALALPLAACASAAPKGGASAFAVLESKSGSKVNGYASFAPLDGAWIQVRVAIAGATPGLHACHIHEKGDCSAPDAASAGGHWNPTGKKHGKWGQVDGEFHLGDLGNIEVGADGMGSLLLTTDQLTVGGGGPRDVLGFSVIVHEKPDDFTTQPTGNAGARVACGPIQPATR